MRREKKPPAIEWVVSVLLKRIRDSGMHPLQLTACKADGTERHWTQKQQWKRQSATQSPSEMQIPRESKLVFQPVFFQEENQFQDTAGCVGCNQDMSSISKRLQHSP